MENIFSNNKDLINELNQKVMAYIPALELNNDNEIMRQFAIIISVSFLLALVGCTYTQYVPLDFSDAKSPKIEIFLSGVQKPMKEYDVISYIETSGTTFTTKEQLLRALKRESVKLGADAVMDVKFFYIPNESGGLPSVSGVAIKYK